jgi:heptosyltransferase I
MSLPLLKAPSSLCLLRLSAIGDVTHILPIVRTLQHYWPETKITWIVGRLEHQLVEDIEGIEFIVFDKTLGLKAYKTLWSKLRSRKFDVFLHMQVSLRSNIASLCVRAPIKLGFDKPRAKDFQWLFSNARIKAIDCQHVLDGFFEFLKALGLSERKLVWDIPVPLKDQRWAANLINDQRVLIINPSSSQRLNNWRNWGADNYAALIDYAIEKYDLRVMLTGGPADNEIALAQDILSSSVIINNRDSLNKIDNLVGKTSLKQLAALMQTSVGVIAPDTGPAHIANALGKPVIGLYVTSNPKRTGPYIINETCSDLTVNRYPQALLKYENISEDDAPWGKRVRDADALDLITIEAVKEKLDKMCFDKVS